MLKFSANLTMLFTERPFLDRFAAAASAGFRAVEYVSPYEYAPAGIAAELAAHKLQQVLFNLPVGNWDAGERGIAIFPDRMDAFRAGVATAIHYAKALGCTQVNCLAGIAAPGGNPDGYRTTFVSNLRYAAAELEAEGIALLIEPINTRDMPGFFLNTSAQALDLIAAVGSRNLFLQYDIYHMQIMEGDLIATISKCRPHIRHVQIADAPGRHEPGTGKIDFPSVLRHLGTIGYTGWIGAEYKPLGVTEHGLDWLKTFTA